MKVDGFLFGIKCKIIGGICVCLWIVWNKKCFLDNYIMLLWVVRDIMLWVKFYDYFYNFDGYLFICNVIEIC